MYPFVREVPLDHTYQLITNEEHYKCTLQLHNAEMLLGIESHLCKIITDSISLKYNGKSKLTSTDTVSTELDKEAFLSAVDKAVDYPMEYSLSSTFQTCSLSILRCAIRAYIVIIWWSS